MKPTNKRLKTVPIKKTAKKSQRVFALIFCSQLLANVGVAEAVLSEGEGEGGGEGGGVVGVVRTCVSKPAGRGLLLKTASRFMK